MRIIAETLAAIREAIGSGLALNMKFAGDDFIDRVWWTKNHGNTLDDAKNIAKRVELLNESIYPSGMVDRHTFQTIYTRLSNERIAITPLSGVKEVQGNTVVTYNTLTGAERQIERVNTVVFAQMGEPMMPCIAL
jgi:2,4-dienoyl-CoA reductase-like NADH-dependent reductase (Old Yellow Enzyme family)